MVSLYGMQMLLPWFGISHELVVLRPQSIVYACLLRLHLLCAGACDADAVVLFLGRLFLLLPSAFSNRSGFALLLSVSMNTNRLPPTWFSSWRLHVFRVAKSISPQHLRPKPVFRVSLAVFFCHTDTLYWCCGDWC